jgi:hypothetical protein
VNAYGLFSINLSNTAPSIGGLLEDKLEEGLSYTISSHLYTTDTWGSSTASVYRKTRTGADYCIGGGADIDCMDDLVGTTGLLLGFGFYCPSVTPGCIPEVLPLKTASILVMMDRVPQQIQPKEKESL